MPNESQSVIGSYGDYRASHSEECGQAPATWHVLWTRSNCEQMVSDQLRAKDYEVFLPKINQWSATGKARKRGPVRLAPMFKGYLFLRHRIDKRAYLDIANTKGVVQVLGARWDRLARVPDGEIDGIRRAAEASLPLRPYPYLRKGQRVRIIRGPLADTVGELVLTDFSKALFVVSIHLLKRSVAVKVDCGDVTPA